MRRALLLLAAITFSQLAAAQTAAGRADSGASTEPQNPADASVAKRSSPQVEPREGASKDETNAGAGATATPLPPQEETPASPGPGATATALPPREPTDQQSEEQKPDSNK